MATIGESGAPDTQNVTVDQRVLYWRIRALTEQCQREIGEGHIATLSARLKAAKTQQRLDAAVDEVRARGGADLTDGTWVPDDATETFVRADAPSRPAPSGV